VDISGIPPSTLANAGLLIACFIVDGEEVAAVNMVVNVRVEKGKILREILNPLESIIESVPHLFIFKIYIFHK